MQNLSIKIENESGNDITIREGKATELYPPKQIIIEGDINSISSFISKRETGHSLQAIDKNRAIVLVDKTDLTIQLLLDPEEKYGLEITAKLDKSDELIPFHINQNKTFTKEELVKLIKFNKLFFDDTAKHSEMLLAFQKIDSTVNIRANESSDDRGNKERAFVKNVTSNAPTEFILNIPIFKGFEPVRFRVEVCLDITEGSARFWFESIELHEIKQMEIDRIFNEQLDVCKDFVIINK